MLHTEESGDVLIIRFGRPAQRNAVDAALAAELDQAFARFENESKWRAAILTGSESVFSAGTDLHEMSSPRSDDGGEYGFVRRKRTKPLIAAISGPAFGGGFEMALACDLIVASTDAQFGLPEVKRGVVANCGAMFRAPDRLPPTIAMEMLLTGDPISAERAANFGLVNVLTKPGLALAGALELATRITANSPTAIAATMTGVRESQEQAEQAGWTATEAAARSIEGTHDRAEGIAAFFEKRAPQWRAE